MDTHIRQVMDNIINGDSEPVVYKGIRANMQQYIFYYELMEVKIIKIRGFKECLCFKTHLESLFDLPIAEKVLTRR